VSALSTAPAGAAAPVAAASPQAAAFVGAFTDGWRAPRDADHFWASFEPWIDPEVRLIQPQLPTVHGHRGFVEDFARPFFDLVSDVHGTVTGWAANGDVVYIELRIDGRVGGRAVTLNTCDRITLRDGRVLERIAHTDPMQFLGAVASSPRAWPTFLKTQLRRLRRTR
jgi:ketosteroid isomerase-like protein